MDIKTFIDSLSFENPPIIYTYNLREIPTALKFVSIRIEENRCNYCKPEVYIRFLSADTMKEVDVFACSFADGKYFAHLDRKTGALSDAITCVGIAQEDVHKYFIKWIVDYYNTNTDRIYGEAVYSVADIIRFRRYQWIANQIKEVFVKPLCYDIAIESMKFHMKDARFCFAGTGYAAACSTYCWREDCIARNKITYYTFDDAEQKENAELDALKAELKELNKKMSDVWNKINDIISK